MKRPENTSVWQFRLKPGTADQIDKKIFASRGDIPPGEGWQDSRDEALTGEAKPAKPAEVPFEALSVAEQVALLEAQAAGKALNDMVNPEDISFSAMSKADIKRVAEATPAKRARKPKAG